MNGYLVRRLAPAALALGLLPAFSSLHARLTNAPPPATGQHLVLQLKGTAVGQTLNIDTDGDGVGDTMADCYSVDLFDPSTGRKIGTAIDCLSDVNLVSDEAPTTPPLGFNLALTGTTFFELPQGTLVTQGLTTVRPVLQPTVRDGITFTHITGANGDGGVRYGTRRFRSVSGKVRLSGQVDLAQLVTSNQITFDCMFVVDLD